MRSKAHCVLKLYDYLMKDKDVIMEEFMKEYKISSRTFRRYINEINQYLIDSSVSKKAYFNRVRNSYVLKEI
jgi:predicted DNA-binding transcriptional regulator YafY